MNVIEKIAKWDKKIEELKRDKAKAEATCENILSQLKEKTGLDDTEEIKKWLSELKEEIEEKRKERDRLIEEFEENWGEVL